MASNNLLSAPDLLASSTKADKIVFYLSLGISLLTLFPITYAIWFRNFPPIKAQHVGMTVAIGIGGIIFNISNSMMQGVLGFDGIIGYCKFWGSWTIFTFGLGVLLPAINMRLLLFHRVFITGNTPAFSDNNIINFFRRFWLFIVLWLPTLVTSIVISSLKGRRGAWNMEEYGLRDCTFSNGFLIWIYVYIFITVLFSWVIYLRMRRIANVFDGVVIKLIKGSNSPWGRIVIVVTDTIMINGYTWIKPSALCKMLQRDNLLVQHKRGVNMVSNNYIKTEENLRASSTYC
ncbi:hypothetical protein BX661DRAFT_183761 [Kickxella alabastrina]|uniref:uncharacterized protein n=1 Tax=Kickxella alabastrina TaxID=61397 RepID=UPI00221F597C|nr:uncharacterized protein BX661DRAFT_183761 [Kickxella alabastrina]KAI7826302.1 hypothetical protein BX661DRAFT_183761 [Kickxella alabastrina]